MNYIMVVNVPFQRSLIFMEKAAVCVTGECKTELRIRFTDQYEVYLIYNLK